MKPLPTSLLRFGQNDARAVRNDLLWLVGLAFLAIATGIGLRDPWPADEPRFALVARDMVASHQWLIPQVGGDVYADKPPLFFWLIAGLITLTGSVRWSFLLPSLAAGIGCVVLIYDLARRLWNREVGLAAGLVLLTSVQFVWQARQAQIDATLCFFTTLSLYGLLRHCLLGPQWKWYAVGWAAAGLGIITKGVGFLPLLVLIPYAMTRKGMWQPRPAIAGGWRWISGPLALLLAVALWLVPMLLAAHANPALHAYRDEILFGQTVTRYAAAWHHHEPFWYFIVEVIPGLWLPLTALLPWLIPRWRSQLRQRDLRMLLPLVWIGLVVLFFSISAGKRGVYILPALPALALVSGPFLAEIAQRHRPQQVLFALAASLAVLSIGGGIYLMLEAAARQALHDTYGIDGVAPLLGFGAVAGLTCVLLRPARGFAVYAAVVLELLVLIGVVVNPVIDSRRSGRALMARAEAMVPQDKELGLVAYKEQLLLASRRQTTNFGHARRDTVQEAADAALWLSQSANRELLISSETRRRCFAQTPAREVGQAHREEWFLVSGQPDPQCVSQGKTAAAITYNPAEALKYSQK